MSPFECDGQDLNLQPAAYKTDALTVELPSLDAPMILLVRDFNNYDFDDNRLRWFGTTNLAAHIPDQP